VVIVIYLPWRPHRDRGPVRRPAASGARRRTACHETCRRRTGGRRRTTASRPRPPWPVRRPARRATGRNRRSRRPRRTGCRLPGRRGKSRRSASAGRWCARRSTGTRREQPQPQPQPQPQSPQPLEAVPTLRPRSSYCLAIRRRPLSEQPPPPRW